MINTRSLLVLAVLGTFFVHNPMFAARLVVPHVPKKEEPQKKEEQGEAPKVDETINIEISKVTDPTYSFTFPIKAYVLDTHYEVAARNANSQGNIELFYVGASVAIEGNDFALAGAGVNSNFSPLAPPKLSVDDVKTMANPLHGACIENLILAYPTMTPVVTISKEPAAIYMMNPLIANVTTCTQINDANGEITSGIVALCSGQSGYLKRTISIVPKPKPKEEPKSEEQKSQDDQKSQEGDQKEQPKKPVIKEDPNYEDGIGNYIVAAVKKKDGNFADKGSGIALIRYNGDNALDKIDALTGKSKGNRAAPLDGSHPAIKIGNDVTITPNIIDMAFENSLQRIYMVMEVTANAGPADGARALVMGSIIGGRLTLLPIAPDSAFNGNNHIIGGVGAGAKISLYKVRTLETSSRLHYVVVAGGNEISGNTVFALPLVNMSPVADSQSVLKPEHGALANVGSIPVDIYFTRPAHLKSRGIVTAAVNPEDMYTMESPAAMVGGGPVPLDPSQKITQMFAMNDAVYVSIGDEPSQTCHPGVYCSQAILDNFGRIACWTPWHRAAGTSQKVFGFAVSNFTDSVWMLQESESSINTVKVTQWSDGAKNGLLGGTTTDTNLGLAYQASQIFEQTHGGIHNIFMFDPHTPSFGQDSSVPGSQTSLMVATGFGKVMLAETGNNASSVFMPHAGDFATDKQQFTDGSLQGLNSQLQTKIISISGGQLAAMGPIVAAEISRTPLKGQSKSGYLFVGGAQGLAVLCESDMTGWDTSEKTGGLHAHFNSLTPTMSFKQLGSYMHVRKLWSDAEYLYVLTRNRLDRIRLASIASPSLDIVTLAIPQALGLPDYAYFSDVGISDKLGVLATSGGLFRVGSGCDIRYPSIVSPYDLKWTQVIIPESNGPAFRLLFISPTHDEGGFAYNGMIYVLNGSATYNQTRINRFFVSDVRNGSITDTTIQPVNDRFLKGSSSYLLEFGELRSYIATDGLAILNSRSRNQKNGSMLKAFSGGSMSGVGFKSCTPYATPHSNFDIRGFPQSPKYDKEPRDIPTSLHRIMRSISGSWIVCGDFGLNMNE